MGIKIRGESVKLAILQYLANEELKEGISILTLSQEIQKLGYIISYSAVCKYVAIMHAEGTLRIRDYGNLKLIMNVVKKDG